MKIFRRLLDDLRVDITVRDKDDRSFLTYAAEYGATKTIQTFLHCPKRQDDIDRLLDDEVDKKGVSPLSYAAQGGHNDTVRLLCQTKKIDSQLRSVDKLDGANAFDIAAKYQHVKVIRELGKYYYRDGVNSRNLTGAHLSL